MDLTYILTSMTVLAIVTYLPRVLPFLLFQKKIKNVFIKSFLSYMPYGMLAAMIFPAVFTSTGHLYSALIGLFVALLLACKKLGLLPVACGAVLAVFLAEQLPLLF